MHEQEHNDTPSRTVSVFRNGRNRAIRLPKDIEIEGVTEYIATRVGDTIVLKPSRPSWHSFTEIGRADDDFLQNREAVFEDEGRF